MPSKPKRQPLHKGQELIINTILKSQMRYYGINENTSADEVKKLWK